MTKQSWWRPVLGLIAFVLWAHPSLVGLPLAALLIVAPAPPERARWAVPLAAVIGAMSLALLFASDGPGGGGRHPRGTGAYIVGPPAGWFGGLVLLPGPTPREAAPRT